jgi:hypothetical protein
MITAYASNTQLRAPLNAFAASTEFGELYVGNQASFVNALYRNAFNRDVEAAGLLFWAGLLNSKQITPAQAVLHIVSDAQNDDATVVAKKIQAATLFRSTDVLVSRTATQLLDAAALANQTFSFYREDCAMGDSNLQVMSFDAQGNGTFPSGSGGQTLNAATVTQLLNGQVLTDPATGKLLAFSAYLYVHGNSVRYVIVQQQGNRQTGVTEGRLAVWSQE